MKVVYVEPTKKATIKEIGSDLNDMQKAVDGLIEIVPLEENIYLVCNEEGKINGMQPNRALYNEDGELNDVVFGPFFICGSKEEDLISLTEEQVAKYLNRFERGEYFFVRDENVIVLPIEIDSMTPEKEEGEND